MRKPARPLVVGEAPGRRHGGEVPFGGPTGERLSSHLHMDVHYVFDVANLLDRWPGRSSKGSAFLKGTLPLPRLSGRPFVLLAGRRVAEAVRLPTEYFSWMRVGRVPVAVVPHPSGVNRWWNEPENRLEFRSFVARAVAEHAPHVLNAGLWDLERLFGCFSPTSVELIHLVGLEEEACFRRSFDVESSFAEHHEERRRLLSDVGGYMNGYPPRAMQAYALRLFSGRRAYGEVRIYGARFGRGLRSTAVLHPRSLLD